MGKLGRWKRIYQAAECEKYRTKSQENSFQVKVMMLPVQVLLLIRYYYFIRIPKSRFFATLYPKPILLSPGTTFQLPITFKPMENIRYTDCIEFYSKVFFLPFLMPSS